MSRRPHSTPVPPSGALSSLFFIFLLVTSLRSLSTANAALFLRADTNQDGRVDVSDPVATLASLFGNGSALPCLDAADSDDNGRLDITDAIVTLGYLFLGRSSLPPPFPEDGEDPTEDGLACGPAPTESEIGPPRPIEAPEVEQDLHSGQLEALSGAEGAIVVGQETFDLLSSLPPGASLYDHQAEPGVQQFIDAFFSEPGGPNCPVAIPDQLTVPSGPDGCYRIDASRLKGFSHDSGSNPTPDGDLMYSTDPEVVCGLGSHLIRFTVTDLDGLTSTASTVVVLCQSSQADCSEVLSSLGDRPTSSGAQEEVRCHWVVTKQEIPPTETEIYRGNTYNDKGVLTHVDWKVPGGIGASPMEVSRSIIGEGPTHNLYVARIFPQCTTPQTKLALLGWGTFQLRMNVLCYTHEGLVPREELCGAFVDLEGSYAGSVKVFTNSGEDCGRQVNGVEALAQEETRLFANGGDVFKKALVVQNGTKIQKKVSYEISGGFGVNLAGAAGDFRITIGQSQEVVEHTGQREAVLNAFGGGRFYVPLLAQLEAGGKAELDAQGRADGKAVAVTNAVSLYAFGVSNCPGANALAVVFLDGHGAAFDSARQNASDFFAQRTGDQNFLDHLITKGQKF